MIDGETHLLIEDAYLVEDSTVRLDRWGLIWGLICVISIYIWWGLL